MIADASPLVDAAGRNNLLQLVQLRWIAVVGQVIAIAVAEYGFDVQLPLSAMGAIVLALGALNVASLLRLGLAARVTNRELFATLALDTAALTAQLYLSGGATNPFAFLFLLQIMLSAVMLEPWSTWAMLALTVASVCGLSLWYEPLALPPERAGDLFALYVPGMLICFALNAGLIAVFVERIVRNLRERDGRLAHLRQQAAEEDHIVRMGMLASGAAHELGTPLATLDVILSDWRRMPTLSAVPELMEEIGEMQAEVRRCKAIVTGILLSAGEARGEAPKVTTVKSFLDDIVGDRRAARPVDEFVYEDAFGEDMAIVSDSALKQVIGNVIDNAADASPAWIRVRAARVDGALALEVADRGPGFPPDMLADFGRPYRSTKGRLGGGLGLFLVVNAMRKLGGSVSARNDPQGGAVVTLTLPLSSLAIAETPRHV